MPYRTMWRLLIAAAGLLAARPRSVPAQQAADAALWRLFQSGAEVGRETVRRVAGRYDQSIVVPLLDVRMESVTEFDAAGRFVRFESRVFAIPADTLRVSFTAVQEGDSVRSTIMRGSAGAPSVRMIPGRAEGAVAPQTIAIVADLIARASGRDTVFQLYVPGMPSLLAAPVRYRGDTVEVMLGPTRAVVAGSRSPLLRLIEVPASAVRGERWNGMDSLPPVGGLRQPTPDYSAPPGAPYTAHDVHIPVRPAEGDTFSIGATLTLPVAGRAPFPAVVTISGSGQQNRDEELWPVVNGYRPFRQIAERLSREGIAVLRYDDRGVGGSGGRPGTTADYADDVRQIVSWLRARPDIDGGRIGLLGHSEGGVIAPLVAASDPRIAAVVLMAGPSGSVREAVRFQMRYAIESNAILTAEERAARLSEVDRSVAEWAQSNPWARWLADYDPLTTARRLRQPVMILHGALDRQVTVGQADTLSAEMRRAGNRDVTLRIWPRLNHLFLHTDGTGASSEYPVLRDVAMPADVLDTLAAWLRQRLIARR